MNLPIKIQNRLGVLLDSDVYIDDILQPLDTEITVNPNTTFRIFISAAIVDTLSGQKIYRDYINDFTVYDKENYSEIVFTLIAKNDTIPYASFYYIKKPCSGKVCYYITSNSSYSNIKLDYGDNNYKFITSGNSCYSYTEFGTFYPKLYIIKNKTELQQVEVPAGGEACLNICCIGCHSDDNETIIIEVPVEEIDKVACATAEININEFIPSLEIELNCDQLNKIKTDVCCNNNDNNNLTVGITQVS